MTPSRLLPLLISFSYAAVTLAVTLPVVRDDTSSKRQNSKDATVLILGGGVAGIIAAETLMEKGIKDFKIIEARDELGGRLHSETFGEPGRQVTVEVWRSLVNYLPDWHSHVFHFPLGWRELDPRDWRWRG